MNRFFPVFLLMSLIVSCGTSTQNSTELEFSFTFEENFEGWISGFSDYPVDEEDFFNLAAEHKTLPAPLNADSGSINIRGDNRSDDLFMFIKRKITGLNANETYRISIVIEFANNAPEESFGAGGSPGSSVFVKAGASQIEPLPEIMDEAGFENGFYRMNIDKGNQSTGGSNMVVIGNAGHDGEEFEYRLIERSLNNFEARTNSSGELWLIIGTDSGFEGTTSLYYNHVEVSLTN